ncbi:MAG: hypothetical protein JNN01_18930 [Opitutaceae bacterium]|nr:hypothetical protein [Opitutaceae bacterium]
MKLGRWCLIGSLLLNGALATVVIVRSRTASALEVKSLNPSPTQKGSTLATQAAPPLSATATPAPKIPWEHLETSDLKLLAARLRHAGFSARDVRLIVTQKLNSLFDAKRVALAQSLPKVAYWREANWSGNDTAFSFGMRAIGREQADLLRATLGDDGTEDFLLAELRLKQKFGDIPSDTALKVQRVVEDYVDLTLQARLQWMRAPLPEYRDRLALLESEQRKDLAAILTPQQLRDYELRTSPTTIRMRGIATALDLTEEQFAAVHRLQKAYDDLYNPGSTSRFPSRNPMLPVQSADEAKLNADIKAILGEDLGNRYAQMRSPDYSTAQAVVSRLGLPASNVQEILAVKQDIERRGAQVRADSSATPSQRQQQFMALVQEASARLRPLLGGDQGLETYKTNGGGWVARPFSTPSPAPPTTTPATPPR